MRRGQPFLTILDRFSAEELLCHPGRGAHLRHVISIGDPGESPPIGLDAHPARRLRLEFHDLDLDPPEPWASIYAAPGREDVSQILKFCAAVDGPTLIHCHAGISRSTAAGLLLLALRLGPGSEDAAANALATVRPHAVPNRRIVALGDELLGRDGALVRALNTRFWGARST